MLPNRMDSQKKDKRPKEGGLLSANRKGIAAHFQIFPQHCSSREGLRIAPTHLGEGVGEKQLWSESTEEYKGSESTAGVQRGEGPKTSAIGFIIVGWVSGPKKLVVWFWEFITWRYQSGSKAHSTNVYRMRYLDWASRITKNVRQTLIMRIYSQDW